MKDFSISQARQEALDYILTEMEKALGDQMPAAEAVRSFLDGPDGEDQLTDLQQLNEINVRVTSDLLRYKMMKQAGVVQSLDEFLERCYPHGEEE